jgi:hypothetical protein
MKNEMFYFEREDEREFIKPPYYNIVYIDDMGKKHLATIARENKEYITFILNRFIIREVKIVEE